MKRSSCSAGSCESPVHAKGLCSTHHGRQLRGVPLTAPLRRRRRPTAERFWADVDMSGGPEACWPWTGKVRDSGYGRAAIPGAQVGAHLAAWFWTYGSRPPQGMQVDHQCHRVGECLGGPSCLHRRCCNPAHLKPLTPLENSRRSSSPAMAFAQRDECDNGHPLSGPNLAIRRDGSRKCRRCHALYMREWNRQRGSRT